MKQFSVSGTLYAENLDHAFDVLALHFANLANGDTFESASDAVTFMAVHAVEATPGE